MKMKYYFIIGYINGGFNFSDIIIGIIKCLFFKMCGNLVWIYFNFVFNKINN